MQLDVATDGLEYQRGAATIDLALEVITLLLAICGNVQGRVNDHTTTDGSSIEIGGDFPKKVYTNTAAEGAQRAVAPPSRKPCPGGSA